MEADLNLEEIEFEHLNIFLAVSLTKEEIKNKNLDQFIYRRKEGKRAGITNKNVWLTEGDKCQWDPPIRQPTKIEKQRMFAEGICVGVKTIMENHIYRFGEELRKQKNGGPIGVELT